MSSHLRWFHLTPIYIPKTGDEKKAAAAAATATATAENILELSLFKVDGTCSSIIASSFRILPHIYIDDTSMAAYCHSI